MHNFLTVSKTKNRKPLNNYAYLILFLLSLSSCVSKYTPIERFKEKEEQRKAKIEAKLTDQYSDSLYQSLAFGQLTVYKPESFQDLDSLYALKDSYIERNDLRGLERSGIEDQIPAYRAEAQNDIDKVRYEIEHVYSVLQDDSIEVFYTVFLLNHNDSIISEDNLYSYKIPKGLEKMHTNYLFEYHFLTNSDIYISRDERDFIKYFKNIENSKAGTEDLTPFITNVLETMRLAKRINSVDYRKLIKYKSIENLRKLGENITVSEFGTLIALKDINDQIIGYEYSIRWYQENDKINKKSIFTYSPTLTLIEIDTVKE